MIYEFAKSQYTEIKVHKCIVFLYTNHELTQRESKASIPLTGLQISQDTSNIPNQRGERPTLKAMKH